MDRRLYALICQNIQNGKMLQRKWEWIAFLNQAARLAPQRVIEIGTYKGGTLQTMANAFSENTEFISLDLPGGGFGGGYTEVQKQEFQAFLRTGQTLTCFRLDSHNVDTLHTIQERLSGKLLDLLFIDGDHTAEGVALDFVMYGPLVRPGGLIGFHDIQPHLTHASCQVHRFWEFLSKEIETSVIVDRDGYEHWGGIGVVRVPETGVETTCTAVNHWLAAGKASVTVT